jgi:hypothetical protein
VSALGFVSLVVFIFFVIGVGVGVIAVIALAVTRRDRAARWAGPVAREHLRPPGGDEPPAAGEETGSDDETWPQWPETGYRPLTSNEREPT